MTIAIPDCGTIILTTTSITNINPADTVELTLTRKFNCGSESTVDFTADAGTIVTSDADGTYFTITAADYYEDVDATKYCEGIYYLEISFTVTIEGQSTTLQDSICVFMDCENIIKCKVKDYYLTSKDYRPFYLLDALEYGVDCDVCECDNMCSVYNDLLATLNLSVNGTTSTCGCS